MKSIQMIFALEPSHTWTFFEKMKIEILDFLDCAGRLALMMTISVLSVVLTSLFQKKHDSVSLNKRISEGMRSSAANRFLMIAALWCLWDVFLNDRMMAYAFIYPSIMISGFLYRNVMSEPEKRVYTVGMLFGLSSLAAAVCLSNLDMRSSFPYLIFASMVSILPILKANADKIDVFGLYLPVVFTVFILTIRTLCLFWPWASIVTKGPDIGIMDNYVGTYMQDETYDEYRQLVPRDAKLYLVGSQGLEFSPYLYDGVTIAAPSVISTPTYNETIAEYWERHPDKYPDVVMMFCWYGEPHLDPVEDAWMYEWLENDFRADRIIDGKYWRYYIKDAENKSTAE